MFENIPLIDMMFYVERIYNMLSDKFENMDASSAIGTLLQRLI